MLGSIHCIAMIAMSCFAPQDGTAASRRFFGVANGLIFFAQLSHLTFYQIVNIY
jgi:hypothetical protein